jgi:hypothetical protein
MVASSLSKRSWSSYFRSMILPSFAWRILVLNAPSPIGAMWFVIHFRPQPEWCRTLPIQNKLATMSTVSTFITFPDILLC